MHKVLEAIQNSITFRALRRGLMMSMPVILIGCFACVLGNLPIPAYSDFIATFAGGFFKTLFSLVESCTVGCVAMWMICFISYSYGSICEQGGAISFTGLSICTYFIFVYVPSATEPMLTRLNSKWTFTALVVTLVTCALYRLALARLGNRKVHIYSTGADNTFSLVLKRAVPIASVILFFGVIRMAIQLTAHGVDFYNFGSTVAIRLFSHVESEYISGLLFMALVHFLWFLGIHGSNMLENVAQIFQANLGSGAILSKTFLDVFVLMGGCGLSISLLAAIFITGRNNRNFRLAKLSLLPGLFNINETVIYGLPIFFNPSMLIPFMAAPLVTYSISYLAVFLGLVPAVSVDVAWQIPFLMSGYLATGSLAGSALQLVNIAAGTLIYIPFIRRLERAQARESELNLNRVVTAAREAEASGDPPELLSKTGDIGDTAKGLADDLRYSIEYHRDTLELFYQPQMNYDGTALGAEALLRWKHPAAGYIYPPLVIELAAESSQLDELGLALIAQACDALEFFGRESTRPFTLSVNISALQLKNPDFITSVRALVDKHDFHGAKLVFELTEQVSLSDSKTVLSQLDELKELDIALSLDDFGMGHSSLMYLQEHDFKFVKIDGNIIKDITENEKSRRIVASMAEFSKKAGTGLIAEFTETREQIELLHSLGCDTYQGFYYSKALPFDEAAAYFREHGIFN